MTANNCDRCRFGDNGSNPEGCSETCFEPDYPDFDPEPTESLCDAFPEAARILEVAQLKSELSTLRESEAKAWGLVEEIVHCDNECLPDCVSSAIQESRAALAARKAGQ